MKARILLLAVILLGVGFGIGFYVRGGIDTAAADGSPDRALDELIAYRGAGASAARRVIEWVDVIVAGGEQMIPRLDRALEEVRDQKYAVGTWSYDLPRLTVSAHTTLRAALAEAVTRIGGNRAVEILIRESDRRGTWRDADTDRIIAYMFLARHAEREDVRSFLEARILGRIRGQVDGRETRLRLQIARPFLSDLAWEPLADAFRDGWPGRPTLDDLAETLFELDRERAGLFFLELLRDPDPPAGVRAAATRAVARLPERREEALPIAMNHTDRSLTGWFIDGMRHGRFAEIEREFAARESMDLDRMIEYTTGRLDDLDEQIAILGRIRAKLDAPTAARLRMPGWREQFEEVRAQGLATLRDLKAAKARREKREEED